MIPSINGDRLWQSLMDMAKIAALPGGGCGRLALTDDDKEGRDLFVSWCTDAGCAIEIDDMGNIFARRAGSSADAKPVATGSHLDTQPHGGKFDGVYGVLAGLEVIRTLNDHGVETVAPIEVVVWTNEEGSRFAPAMISSGVYADVFDVAYAHSRTDSGGKTLGEELVRIGYDGDTPCGDHELGAFFEVHIEQGPILEQEQCPIGVVIGGQGQRWYDVRVDGQDAHSGSTPMPGRRDALVASAEMVSAIERVALSRPPYAVATVGALDVSPNSRNTIPGSVTFTVDIRNPDVDCLQELDELFRAGANEIAKSRNVDIHIDEIWHNPPVVFDADCIAAVSAAATEMQVRHREIVSGAGHDACMLARKVPTSMIFIPCEGGLSHNEAEYAEPVDLAMGCEILMRAMLQMAKVTDL